MFFFNQLYFCSDAKNERLWFKTNTKLAKLYFDIGNYTKMQKVIVEIKQSCQTPDGKDDMKKGLKFVTKNYKIRSIMI